MFGIDLPYIGTTTEYTTIQNLTRGDWVGVQSAIPNDSGPPAKSGTFRFFQVISVFHDSSTPANYTVWGFDGSPKAVSFWAPADTRVFRLLPSATT
jgi:hypothetical protein